jgi:aspartate/methionine/tyrosine aminotransferase
MQDTMPSDAVFNDTMVETGGLRNSKGTLSMQQRSFLTRFMRDHLDKLDLSTLFAEYRAAEFSPDTFHLGIGEIADITDTATWHAIMQAFYGDSQLVAHTTMYPGTHGAQDANQAIAEHIGALLGRPEFNDQNVLTYDGAHNAIHGVIRTCVMPLGSPDDERQYVLVPTPCYPYFPTILNAYSGVLAYVAYSADELVEGIEAYVNPGIGAILINTPNNPLGFALNRDHVERINRAVAPYHCVLAVDMVYALASNDPHAIRALAAFDPERTIYVDSFSKKFGLPGFRLGYIATANPELLKALRMMKASESIATSTVKARFGAHLLRHHAAIAEATTAAIQSRYSAFRQALEGIEEYGVEVPSPADQANAFYLPLFLDRFLQRTALTADAFNTLCRERYGLDMVSGTRMYPPGDLSCGELTRAAGKTRIASPGPVVYAPDFATRQRPFLRLSFGVESRIAAAAARLQQAFSETFAS